MGAWRAARLRRIAVNRCGEMEVCVQAVDGGGFSAAEREMA
jgi:hypothetical protein